MIDQPKRQSKSQYNTVYLPTIKNVVILSFCGGGVYIQH